MLRPYLPHALRTESAEFILECASSFALGAAIVYWLFT